MYCGAYFFKSLSYNNDLFVCNNNIAIRYIITNSIPNGENERENNINRTRSYAASTSEVQFE